MKHLEIILEEEITLEEMKSYKSNGDRAKFNPGFTNMKIFKEKLLEEIIIMLLNNRKI